MKYERGEEEEDEKDPLSSVCLLPALQLIFNRRTQDQKGGF